MEKRKRRLAYLMIAPVSLWLLFFIGLPIVDTFRTSLFKTSYKGERFVGLANYLGLIDDKIFQLVLKNSIISATSSLASSMPATSWKVTLTLSLPCIVAYRCSKDNLWPCLCLKFTAQAVL